MELEKMSFGLNPVLIHQQLRCDTSQFSNLERPANLAVKRVGCVREQLPSCHIQVTIALIDLKFCRMQASQLL